MFEPVHIVAQAGFGKGTNELYDRARPSYPSAALCAIKAALNPTTSLNVVEIGSGTGIFTRALLAHPAFSTAISEIRAIEPSKGMRDQFSCTVNDPRVSVKEGTFEQTHVPDGWADLIIVAQAFHWCPDYNNAMAEFARALGTHGRAILIWNLEDDKTAWVHQLRQVVEAHELGTPQYRLGLWRQAFQVPSYIRYFQPAEELVFRHTVQTTTNGVLERAFSKSYIAICSEADKMQIAKDLVTIIERGDQKVWIHEKEDTFEYPYQTRVVIITKKLEAGCPS